MNSEELEQSLRTEFETYLNGVVAEMRQDVVEFQKNIESEFEKHKNNLDESFRAFTERLDSDPAFDNAFTESVVEHLRLARDEGAKITATAFAEAEKMQEATSATGNYADIRNAIDDISGKNSQASILKSLVEHSSDFTSRGAFFIVKNDKLVGWKVFGRDAFTDDDTARSVEFSTESNTVLADAVAGLSTRSAAFNDASGDSVYLDRLGFGAPDTMYAIPLTARGRSVAVLYADTGNEGSPVNVEALESLVRVAGLTVELLASAQPVKAQEVETGAEESQQNEKYDAFSHISESNTADMPEVIYEDTSRTDIPEVIYEDTSRAEIPEIAEPAFETTENVGFEMSEPAVENSFDEGSATNDYGSVHEVYAETPEETSPWSAPAAEPEVSESFESTETHNEFVYSEAEVETSETVEAVADLTETVEYSEPEQAVQDTETVTPASDFSFASNDSYGSVEYESTRLEEPAPSETVEEVVATNGSPVHAAEPVVEVAGAQASRTRLSDRNVDLPIEVADDERRLHNDARRFARLLVSEIKLYNEQKVTEGRDAGDLYDRLREAIDRSREMYEKRVQPPVAAKFDYFHYELVNSLGDGDSSRLGSNYPGASV